MKLHELLTVNSRHRHPGALKNNLGDAFLMANNQVFRRVRELALEAGIKFTAKRFYHYDSLSLTQLPKILHEKTVPYCDNVRPLREIEDAAPGVFNWSEVPPLRANYLLHETAHVLVYRLRLKALKAEQKKDGSPTSDEIVLVVLIEESFANACESLANADAVDSVHDEFLFKNSYVMEKAPARKLIRKSIQDFGQSFTFKVLFFSFLHANFVKTRMESIDFDRVLKVLRQNTKQKAFNSAQIEFLKKLFKVGFDLDPAFTIFTNAFCIRLMGVKGDLMDLLQFDFMKYFNRPDYGQLLLAMTTCFEEKEI